MSALRYVKTADIRLAVAGHELDVLSAIGIAWREGRGHIDCPYPDHGGADDWRWDSKTNKAFCTCSKANSIFDVVAKIKSLSFEEAKIAVAELIGRTDLVSDKAPETSRTSPEALLNRPACDQDNSLPGNYLAFRLGIPVDDLLLPSTRVIGLKALDYFDPPGEDKKYIKVGRFPAVIFETLDAWGNQHALRIYVAENGTGKAALGVNAHGKDRDAKKSARANKGEITSGRCVIWGNADDAAHLIVAEGVETAAAVAQSFREEIECGHCAVLAAISATGIEAVQPWPSTTNITVAADRDEKIKGGGQIPSRRGEQAAKTLAARLPELPIKIALQGAEGQSVDWLDIFRRDGALAVKQGIGAADTYAPSDEEISAADRQLVRDVLVTITSGQELDLQRFGQSELPATAVPPAIIALQTDAELDDYTYRVAGCVGEFWTKICRAHLFPNARLDEAQLIADGIRFGQGLQLVNILRDLPADLKNGRCYLPAERLGPAGLTPETLLTPANETVFLPLYRSYLDRAEAHLTAGWRYINTLPYGQFRVRLGCAWPVLIGLRTLALLRPAGVAELQARVKITRPQVRSILFRSLLASPFPGIWRHLDATLGRAQP